MRCCALNSSIHISLSRSSVARTSSASASVSVTPVTAGAGVGPSQGGLRGVSLCGVSLCAHVCWPAARHSRAPVLEAPPPMHGRKRAPHCD